MLLGWSLDEKSAAVLMDGGSESEVWIVRSRKSRPDIKFDASAFDLEKEAKKLDKSKLPKSPNLNYLILRQFMLKKLYSVLDDVFANEIVPFHLGERYIPEPVKDKSDDSVSITRDIPGKGHFYLERPAVNKERYKEDKLYPLKMAQNLYLQKANKRTLLLKEASFALWSAMEPTEIQEISVSPSSGRGIVLVSGCNKDARLFDLP